MRVTSVISLVIVTWVCLSTPWRVHASEDSSNSQKAFVEDSKDPDSTLNNGLKSSLRKSKDRELVVTNCGCSTCTPWVLDRIAGGYSVRSRIDWVMNNMGRSETLACDLVCRQEFPSICSECDPSKCNNTPSPTRAPTPIPTPLPSPSPTTMPTPSNNFRCGCSSCTATILDRMADGHRVRNRIDWVMNNMGRSETQACDLVCRTEFPSICGECDPSKCNSTPSPTQIPTANPTPLPTVPPTPLPSSSPTANPTPLPSSSPTAKPTPLPTPLPTSSPTAMPTPLPTPLPSSSPTAMPTPLPSSSPTKLPTLSPTALPTPQPSHIPTDNSRCGCSSCTPAILDRMADGYTVISRIEWVMNNMGRSETQACDLVCRAEFPSICGECDPSKCSNTPSPTPPPTLSTLPPTTLPTLSPTTLPTPQPSPIPSDGSECGCSSCTTSVLNRIADGYTVISRIEWVKNNMGYSEAQACTQVCGTEFRSICSECDSSTCNSTPPPTPTLDPSKLVWSDEFDVDGLPDSSKWTYDIGGHGWGNNELQYYTNRIENANVSGGRLQIRAVRENYGGRLYTSARMVTRQLGDWKYGRIQVRAKLSECNAIGTWPAIWMLPTDWVYGGWPDSGEIDIMEHVGKNAGTVHGTVHTKAFNHMIGTDRGSSIEVDLNQWHLYEIIWEEDKIQFFTDDVLYFVFTKGNGFEEWPFDQDFHLLLNIAVGGSWGGPEVDESEFEGTGQIMEIDYVRVYNL